ncbi:MAG: pyruvate formate lyase family protein [Chloroflexota bacterium]
MRERVSRIRERLFTVDDRTVFWERVLALKQASEKHRAESGARLYALAMREVTENISVVIGEDDLIVGQPLEVLLSLEEEALLADYGNEYLRPLWFTTRGHLVPAWDIVLGRGLLSVKQEAEERIASLSPDEDDAERRREFWEAVAISCQAVVDLSLRYASQATRMAEETPDPARRHELRRVADACRQVPAHPARTFHEAVQAMWFTDFVLHAICGARDYSVGRLDQWLLPYYERDIASGVISREDALELIECMYIKMNEFIGFNDHYTTPVKRSVCRDSVQYLVVAGQQADGSDATNAVSFLCLEAADDLRIKEPNLTVRYHSGIDRSFWMAVCEAVRSGVSIGIYNDETVIASLTNLGLSLEDARGYLHYGCCNPHLPGWEPQLREYQHSLVKCLELALNDGHDPYPVKPPRIHTELGEHSPGWPVDEVFAGPPTGNTEDLKTFADLMAATKTQIANEVDRAIALKRRFYEEDYLKHRVFCFESVLMHDCVARGKDLDHGGARYVHHNNYAAGLANVADSLLAIKKAVYEEGWLNLSELRDLLATNFVGKEDARQRLINKYPKFGNDDDEVDGIAREIAECFCQEVLKHRDPVVGVCWPGIYSYHRFKSLGYMSGATPDGRLSGMPLSENQGPGPGRDLLGPTAMLRSLAKLPFHLTPGGGQTTALHPTLFSGAYGTKRLSELVETYFHLGGQHLQLNVVTAEMLREAQREPEKYKGLVVRVTGYCAYFVTLDRQSQDILIAAADHSHH